MIVVAMRALRIALFALGSIALLAIFPCRRIPEYRPGEITSYDNRDLEGEPA